jgi:hypothetical protein
VSIVKTDTPDPVVAGENLTYSLAVANGVDRRTRATVSAATAAGQHDVRLDQRDRLGLHDAGGRFFLQRGTSRAPSPACQSGRPDDSRWS